jgi:Spy/CpxP family protein refolding chaperone
MKSKSISSRFALLGLALSIVSFVPVTFAQDSSAATSDNAPASQHRAPDPEKQAARLAKHLGLNDDQAAKITTILQDRQQQLAATRSDSSLSQQDRRAKLRSIQQDTDSQINALLTPDQQKQYAQMKQNMKDRWHNAHGASNATSSSDSDGH